jgi:hypothetical protein
MQFIKNMAGMETCPTDCPLGRRGIRISFSRFDFGRRQIDSAALFSRKLKDKAARC